MKALILAADGFEDLTLFLPWYRLREDGFTVRLAAPLMHAVAGLHGYRVEPDVRIHEVNPAEYDAVVVPDGPCVERLRQREAAVDVIRTFAADGTSRVAAIGHGPQLLISGGVLDGRVVTCDPGIRDERDGSWRRVSFRGSPAAGYRRRRSGHSTRGRGGRFRGIPPRPPARRPGCRGRRSPPGRRAPRR